jgi:alpha-L-rhamnosidase
MEVTIPPNSTATVFVPTKDAASVTESGKPAGEAKGVKFLRMENNAAVYAVGSGDYQFRGMNRGGWRRQQEGRSHPQRNAFH